MIQQFCLHLLNRYGTQTVSKWKIEIVANAPEDHDSVSRYCSFYQMTYAILQTTITKYFNRWWYICDDQPSGSSFFYQRRTF